MKNLELKKLDIVYFVKNTARNDELIHSVRSVVENMPYHKIWFLGGCPEGILPDFHFAVEPISSIKGQTTANLMKIACQIPEISSNFILMNDDFFILKPIKNLPAQWWGTLDETANKVIAKYGNTRWASYLSLAAEELRLAGLTEYDFDLHVPMIINKNKMLKIIKKFPAVHCKRSLYGNYYGLAKNGRKEPDVKIHGLDLMVFETTFLSTDDNSFKRGAVGSFIRTRFPEPSKYEP